jgi:hypothetical protein
MMSSQAQLHNYVSAMWSGEVIDIKASKPFSAV